MRRNFITAAPDESLPGVHQTMRLARLRHVLVAQEGRLRGILSYRDLVEFLLGDSLGGAGAGRHPPLSEATVERAMSPTVVVATATTPLAQAAAWLVRYHYGCLPVVDEPSRPAAVAPPLLKGVVTETDLLRAVYGPPS